MALLVVLKVPKQQQCHFKEIMSGFLKILHRPCCEQFQVRTISFRPNNTYHLYHCAEGSLCQLKEEMFVFVKAGCKH